MTAPTVKTHSNTVHKGTEKNCMTQNTRKSAVKSVREMAAETRREKFQNQ